jgi:hypothetical protein
MKLTTLQEAPAEADRPAKPTRNTTPATLENAAQPRRPSATNRLASTKQAATRLRKAMPATG